LQALFQFAERRLQLAANDHRRIGFRAARHQSIHSSVFQQFIFV
jgi:hypothetical protein